MARSLAALLAATTALAGAALAADSGSSSTTTVVPVLFPLFDKQDLVGSVVDAEPKLTTFAVACAPGVKPEDCGFPGTFTVLQGPETWSLSFGVSMSLGDSSTVAAQDANCKLDAAKDVATCVATESQLDGETTMQTSTSEVLTGYKSLMIPVTVTAGLDKLSAPAPGATQTDAQAKPTTGASSTGASTGASASVSATASGSGAAAKSSSASSTTTTNAAGPAVTQNAVLAGVAAVVGGAMMM
ncbi:hypothetical protein JDV02_007801 [Purpureocillium takamizusanense]|uniref:Uncharacterized protein n=1 Tax=Purpureocillium takamizusanense TaxID=2060973 RepID=A0A9Q8QIY4_9HYPO|nr:uncharacterized protein JDV02_007801 [Purpureocillium takamizusanense]UNI21849.1 hypothetical protein JDV02_007801 [Purpureocillium takamizusanense]